MKGGAALILVLVVSLAALLPDLGRELCDSKNDRWRATNLKGEDDGSTSEVLVASAWIT